MEKTPRFSLSDLSQMAGAVQSLSWNPSLYTFGRSFDIHSASDNLNQIPSTQNPIPLAIFEGFLMEDFQIQCFCQP